ncbi:papain like cysteine protease AvrRpt2 [Nitrosospira sp. Nsp2]|uniref:papain-like cysteine protease family protein n=1 Tax=Nitrosospira sp. Nsp2 TaxID=136548 RepID=UPI000D31C43B|nr:papain-like cysteine protease family protein [Nitrosospira sp. Nsp2]PTR16469.1 papain like cysteine protease AvrRpt2 [Nitrosospira sp. Nsp2]
MNLSEYIHATSRPYSSLLKELTIWGKLFSSKQLAFNMQTQTASNWCWAAASASVSHFYWWWSTWTQCRVANGELGHSDCCNSPVPAPCNVPWYLDRALTRTNNFVSTLGQGSFQQVKAEIDACRPVGARIGWNGGGGHFIVIHGYSRILDLEYFDIDDPIYGKSHMTVSDFASNYQGSGTWTHTYFTKSYFKMPIKYLIPVEPILRRIWEARPLLQLKQGKISASESAEARASRDAADEERAALGMAHRVYSLGLDSLLGQREAAPDPVALRVFETVEGTPQAFYDVTEEAEPRVLQMSAAKRRLDLFSRGLSEVLATIGKGDQEAELRVFQVPGLNFEALWISYEGEGQDVLIPLHTVGRLAQYKPVFWNEALDALREAARPLADMDDTMGA